MHRIVLAASFAAIVLVTACGTLPSASPSAPSQPSPTPSAPVSATPSPEPSVAPTGTPAAPEPTPAPSQATAEEQFLIDGVLRGGEDCRPVRADLPAGAIAGVECTADDPAVARLGLYLFADEATMLEAYFARMASEGIATESGGCGAREGEGSYIPFEGLSPDRAGCFINDAGYANYRYTRSGSNVYVGLLGTSDDMDALVDFAWLGSRDTPGNPTLWAEPDR